MQAKTGEADDSLSLNHLVWHQLLDQKNIKIIFSEHQSHFSECMQLMENLSLCGVFSLFIHICHG